MSIATIFLILWLNHLHPCAAGDAAALSEGDNTELKSGLDSGGTLAYATASAGRVLAEIAATAKKVRQRQTRDRRSSREQSRRQYQQNRDRSDDVTKLSEKLDMALKSLAKANLDLNAVKDEMAALGNSDVPGIKQEEATSERHVSRSDGSARTRSEDRPAGTRSSAYVKEGRIQYSGNPADYALQRVLHAGGEGVILVTWANYHYLDFVINWLTHIHKLGITSYMVGCSDNDTLKALLDYGEGNVFAMQTGVQVGDLGWGSSQFYQLQREKILTIEAFADMGYDVLVSDVDVVWMRDPFPYMAQYLQADILTSSDLLANTTKDDGLERFEAAGQSGYNVGIVLIRKTARSFLQEWNAALSKDEHYWEQAAFNDLLKRGLDAQPQADRLGRVYDGKLTLGVLPVALFASGHTFYIQNLAQHMGLEPYAAHNTFQFSGTPGKRHRFRERLLWLADGPEYFDPPGGLLGFDLLIRDDYLESASHLDVDNITQPIAVDSFSSHFNLVNEQLVQLRNAFMLCFLLNRTLILPHLVSGADRWWAPHHGIMPGAEIKSLPRNVPADVILDIESWTKSNGDNIRFREYSFMKNQRTPQSVKSSIQGFNFCKDPKDCSSSKSTEVGNSSSDFQYTSSPILVAQGMDDAELVKVFMSFKDVKVLHFQDLRGRIGHFQSMSEETR